MKLPLWRLLTGFGVFVLLAVILISLAPVYLDNYRLNGYLKTLISETATDEALRGRIVVKAHELNLPLKLSEVKITHPNGARMLEANYLVEMNLGLYQVDLHFHPHAQN